MSKEKSMIDSSLEENVYELKKLIDEYKNSSYETRYEKRDKIMDLQYIIEAKSYKNLFKD